MENEDIPAAVIGGLIGGVIAISKDEEDMFWYHVHSDREIPKGYDIAIHIR